MLTVLIAMILSLWTCSVAIFVYEYRKFLREETSMEVVRNAHKKTD